MISNSRHLTFFVISLLAFVALTAAGQEDTLDRRFLMVSKLIESSSGARQVEDSGIETAIKAREEARRLYMEARSSADSADIEAAEALLTAATKKMFQATRLASDSLSENKEMTDLAKLERSVDALVKALGTIENEGDVDFDFEKVATQVDGYRSRAAAMVQNHQLDGAMAMMAQAYDVLKSAIEEVRGGETLTKSIHFDSVEEEYAYELDRNDTHRMLVTILAKQDPGNSAKNKMITEFLLKATALRAEADNYAANNDINSAMQSLEASTRQLIRIIRMSGVYVPG
jgi:hypothetical protein